MHKDIRITLAGYIALPIIKQSLCIYADEYMYYMRFMRVSGYNKINQRTVIYIDSYGYFNYNEIVYIFNKYGRHIITYRPGITRDRYGIMYDIINYNYNYYTYIYHYINYKFYKRIPWIKGMIECKITDTSVRYNYDNRIDIIINLEYQIIIIRNIINGKVYENLPVYYDKDTNTILYHAINGYIFILPDICKKRAYIKYK